MGEKISDGVLEMWHIEGLREKVHTIAEDESRHLSNCREPCTEPSHIYGELALAFAEAADHYIAARVAKDTFFIEKVVGKNPTAPTEEILEAIREHSLNGAVEMIRLSAQAINAIKTIKEWSDEQ